MFNLIEKYTLRGIPREGEDGSGSGYTDASVSSSSPFGNVSPLQAGAVGIGLASLMGSSPELPAQIKMLESSVPGLYGEAQELTSQGSVLAKQGTEALGMAQRGELTPSQQAQLDQYHTGLTNQSRQMFANMGRNPDQDTAFINQTANVDAQVNAMAQQQIQTTITLGLGELSSGSSYAGQGLGFAQAANNALIEAGKEQIKINEDYSKALTATFTAIGSMFGSMFKGIAAA